jgi:hypothetical protein
VEISYAKKGTGKGKNERLNENKNLKRTSKKLFQLCDVKIPRNIICQGRK